MSLLLDAPWFAAALASWHGRWDNKVVNFVT
jgi:hypothetical protein